LLPAGEDPDTLVRQGGPKAMREVLDAARPLADMLWEAETLGRSLDTPERRAGLRQAIKERIARIADRAVAADYRLEMDRRLAERFAGGATNRQPKQPFSARTAGWRNGPPGLPLGGEAARRGVRPPEQKQAELLLVTVITHPTLLHRHAEELAGVAMAGELDRLRSSLVDLAADHHDLDAEKVKGHLSEKGFSGMLNALLVGTRTIGFVDPQASSAEAEEGFVHILGLIREREAKRETEAAAERLAEEWTEEALARFEARQSGVQHGESRRRDLDRDGPLSARTKR
jgi:DNA primase